MSRARHHEKMHEKRGHHKAGGGDVKPYNAQGSHVEKEAEEKARGGRAARKHGGHVDGHKPKHHRLDRPGRKRGGSVGADMHPLSSAARMKDPTDHHAGASGESEDD